MANLFANDTIGPSNEYQEQLRKEHSGYKWGSTGARYSGVDILSILNDRPYIQTVLDYGAGKASLGRFLTEQRPDLRWTNYDPGMAAYDVLPDGKFDCVVSTDMLEHVEPQRLEDTLRIMASKAGKVLISDIACYPTGKLFSEGPYKGQDMHLIVESPEWWKQRLAETGLHLAEFIASSKYSKGKYKDRCFMIHERV